MNVLPLTTKDDSDRITDQHQGRTLCIFKREGLNPEYVKELVAPATPDAWDEIHDVIARAAGYDSTDQIEEDNTIQCYTYPDGHRALSWWEGVGWALVVFAPQKRSTERTDR